MLESTTAYGLDFLVPTGDTGVGQALRQFGEFARVEVELIVQFVGDGTYVDVGANLGSIALPVARTARRVVAFEANRAFAGLLAANALNNRLYNVDVHHAAVGESQRLAKFPMMPLSAHANLGESGFAFADRFPDEVVQMTTLDAACPSEVSFVKIDVEGYEAQVLAGSARVVDVFRPAWLVESSNDTPGNRAVLRRFREAGYGLWWFLAPFVTPQSEREGDAALRAKGDINVLALPDGRTPPWPMPPVTDDATRPTQVAQYRYLQQFGYERAAWREDPVP